VNANTNTIARYATGIRAATTSIAGVYATSTASIPNRHAWQWVTQYSSP
jgi:hypothetical protein